MYGVHPRVRRERPRRRARGVRRGVPGVEPGGGTRHGEDLTGSKSSTADELDFEGLDYSTEDWGSFQLGLHVLSACRDIRDRLTAFETRLYTTLRTITEPEESTSGPNKLLLQSPLNSADLQSLLTSLSPPLYPLPAARDALQSFTRASQLFLQRIILSPLRAHLDAYPSLPVWTQPEKPTRRGDLHIPSFSLSPTDTIARVSEGLLNLLRVFEVYAADESMNFSIHTLPFVIAEVGSDETVMSTWISSLTLSLLAHLTRRVLPQVRALSGPGAAQMSSDLGYLSNAVRALDVEWEELERWRAAAGEGEEGWKGRLRESGEGEGGGGGR